jgi:hypothetical protein
MKCVACLLCESVGNFRKLAADPNPKKGFDRALNLWGPFDLV